MNTLIKVFCLRITVICGIDEAGRGPVMGPLVVAGIQIEREDVFRGIGIRDSKRCTPGRRERLAEIIREKAKDICVMVLRAREIDALRKRRSLNEIEKDLFLQVMRRLRSDIYYVDSVDVDADRFASLLERELGFGAKIVSEHRAEDKYDVVAAASIIAKTERDRFVREIEMELRKKLDIPLGSGYPSDPNTIRFLREWVKRYGELPPYVRRSWRTVRKLRFEQSRL